MKKFFYLFIAAIVFLTLITVGRHKKNADTPEGRFLKACILENRGSLKLSDAKKVCECILAHAKDSNIDLDIMAHEYTKHSIDPYATFGDDKMRDIDGDCFSSIMTSHSSEGSTQGKKSKSNKPLPPVSIEQKFWFPFGTAPTKKIYITFTTEKGQTFLIQSDEGNAGGADESSMYVVNGGLFCSAEMSYSIDRKYSIDSRYSDNRRNLVGKSVPLKKFSIQISGDDKEIWKEVSSDFTDNNYLLVDSLIIDPSNVLKVWGTIHCTMTSDGLQFTHQINDGKFSLFWHFH
jgi:hypothetical protein